ncbi:hypothetical protein [Pseudonocardia alni]|uniref:hypothetical protein n=1 Tax=Pseudonocardia alni TaxID=33907 RepID=UPI00331C35A0
MHDRPPRDIEYKTAALAAPVARATTPSPDRQRVTAVLGPTGVVRGGDLIEAGALAAAIRRRRPRVAVAHDWSRPAGIVTSAVEVPPGDPRLPATTSDGEPWPRDGGGLIMTVDMMTSTTDGRLATKSAQSAGPRAAWSYGFRVITGRTDGRVRRIAEVDVFTVCPPSAGRGATGVESKNALPFALEIKGAGRGTKSTAPVSVQLPTDGRWVYRCLLCGLPSGLADRALPNDTRYVCRDCVDSVSTLADPLPPLPGDGDEPIDGPNPHRVGAESAYRQALDAEREYEMDAFGSLIDKLNGQDG